jgi:hypothetical protein
MNHNPVHPIYKYHPTADSEHLTSARFLEVPEMISTSKNGGGQNARATGGPVILPGAKLGRRPFSVSPDASESLTDPKFRSP